MKQIYLFFLAFALSFFYTHNSQAQVITGSNSFNFDNWPAGSTSQTNTVGSCQMTTTVSGANFLNSAPYFDGLLFTPTSGQGLALDHDWPDRTTATTVTMAFSPAILNPTLPIFDINRTGPCADLASNAWSDSVIVSVVGGTITATSSTPAVHNIVGSGTATVRVRANLLCTADDATVTFAMSGSITSITVVYRSALTLDRSPSFVGCGTANTAPPATCLTGRVAVTNPRRQFITIGNISGQTCCLNTGVARIAPTGAQCSGTQLNFSSTIGGNWTSNNPVGTNSSGTNFSFTPINSGTTATTLNVNYNASSNVNAGSNLGQTTCNAAFTPTINPIPTVNDPANQTLCEGATTTAINFSGNGVAGTSFNWTNNNSSIGLAAAGVGNIGAFTASSVTATVTATVTVSPVAAGCSGTPQTFTYTINNCLLPVELLHFYGRKETRNNVLYWGTASELNANYFSIEYAIDGINFESVGSLASQAVGGNSATALYYNYAHRPENNNKTAYYRLRQVDFDGSFSYSQIVAIEGDEGSSDINLYPNPAKGELNLQVNASMIGQPLKIINTLGQTMLSGSVTNEYNKLNINNLAAGLYILLLNDGEIKKSFWVTD